MPLRAVRLEGPTCRSAIPNRLDKDARHEPQRLSDAIPRFVSLELGYDGFGIAPLERSCQDKTSLTGCGTQARSIANAASLA